MLLVSDLVVSESDLAFFTQNQIQNTKGGRVNYLREWVFGVPAHEAYLDKVGGARLAAIRASSTLGFAPGLDRRDGRTRQ